MTLASHEPPPAASVIAWLMDGDPSIRWQVMRDLTDAAPGLIAAERARVATTGWGTTLLGEQGSDGNFGDGVATTHWRATLFTLLHLRYLGVEPASVEARVAVARVREQVTWCAEFDGSPFFEGETEPCINGHVLVLGAYFGHPSERLLERLLGEQLADGGWNCEAERGSVRSSFHTTICVLERLLAYEQATGFLAAITGARQRAHDYLLSRRLFRSLSTSEVIDERWTRFTFPTLWQYDVLRGLDYLRNASVARDARMDEALLLVRASRAADGRWLLDATPRDAIFADLEDGAGQPSRWNTLRALRVLRWYGAYTA